MSDKPSSQQTDPNLWVDDHGDVLFRYAVVRVKDQHVAEDLVQETLIAGLKGLSRFKGTSSIRTWLVGILKHKIIDHHRKKSREVPSSDLALLEDETESETLDRLAKASSQWSDWNENPDKLLENKEFWTTMTGCLDGLPDHFRRAFSMREFDAQSTDEICKIMDITPTNLWVILHRARARLRKCLEANWFQSRSR